MSSVFKRSGTWYLRFRRPDGKWAQQASAARNREEAKRLAAERELKNERIRNGLEVEPGDPSLTFGGLFEWWWTTHGSTLTGMTVGGKADSLRKHVLPPLRDLVLREVTSARLELVFDEMSKTLTGSSVNTLRAAVRAIFGRASKRGIWLGANPVAGTERRKQLQQDFDELAAEEVPVVLEQLDARWRPLFATAIFTGMRKGELAALRKDAVDLRAGTITIGRSWKRETTKGGSTKAVPIAAALRPYIEHAISSSKGPLVFPGPDGQLMRVDRKLAPVLRRALARAGLTRGWLHVCRRRGDKPCDFSEQRDHDRVEPCPRCTFRLWPRPIYRHIRFQDLRATTATLLALSGAAPAVAQRVLRHSDPALTMKVYTRVRERDMRAALDAMVPGMEPVPVAEPVQLAPAMAANLAAPVLHHPESATARATSTGETLARLGTSDVLPARVERAASSFGGLQGAVGVPFPAVPQGASQSSSRGVAPAARDRRERQGSLDPASGAALVLQSLVQLLTVREVAALLRVSTSTVYDLAERGDLPHLRVSNAIRFEASVVAAFVAGRRP